MKIAAIVTIICVVVAAGSLLTARSALRISQEMSQALHETAISVAARDSLNDLLQIGACADGVILTLQAVTDSFRVAPNPAVYRREATTDRWGNPITVWWQSRLTADGGEILVDVHSAGPDGKTLTDDDISFGNAIAIGRRTR